MRLLSSCFLNWRLSGFAAALAAALLAAPAPAIDFLTKPDAIPAADARPRVIVFGAVWCGWCRKLAADTLASPLVEQRNAEFVWLRIDVDDHPAFAERYGVTGLPLILVTDAAGNVMGEKAGYLPPDEFLTFLDDTLKHPRASQNEFAKWLSELSAAEASVRQAATKNLLKDLARTDSQGRDQAIARLKEIGPQAWAEVTPYLEHPRLSVRAAAGGLLRRATIANREFDPFVDRARRGELAADWSRWVSDKGGVVPRLSFVDWDVDASAWSPEGNADRPPAPPLAQPLEPASKP